MQTPRMDNGRTDAADGYPGFAKAAATMIDAGALSILTGAELKVWIALARRANRRGTCYPGGRRIATDAGVSVASVWRAVAGLERKGHVQRTPGGSPKSGKRKSSTYRILLPVANCDQSHQCDTDHYHRCDSDRSQNESATTITGATHNPSVNPSEESLTPTPPPAGAAGGLGGGGGVVDLEESKPDGPDPEVTAAIRKVFDRFDGSDSQFDKVLARAVECGITAKAIKLLADKAAERDKPRRMGLFIHHLRDDGEVKTAMIGTTRKRPREFDDDTTIGTTIARMDAVRPAETREQYEARHAALAAEADLEAEDGRQAKARYDAMSEAEHAEYEQRVNAGRTQFRGAYLNMRIVAEIKSEITLARRKAEQTAGATA